MLDNRIPFPIPLDDRKALVKLGEKLVAIRRKSTSANLGQEYEKGIENLNSLTNKLRVKYGV